MVVVVVVLLQDWKLPPRGGAGGIAISMGKFHPKTQTQDWSETTSHHTQPNTDATATFNTAAKKYLGSWQMPPLATRRVITLHFLQCSFWLLHLSGNQTGLSRGDSWCKCDLKNVKVFFIFKHHGPWQRTDTATKNYECTCGSWNPGWVGYSPLHNVQSKNIC